MAEPLNWNSRRLTHGPQKGVTAFYYGLGMDAADFDRPQVGVGVPMLDGNLCNAHAVELGREVAAGCRAAGLIGLPFGVPAVSDNITQGHEGGAASLVSRNMIASAAEMVCTGHAYDAIVGLHCCDKNGPGFAMALARTNYPGLILSGGSIKPGTCRGRDVTILDVYDSQAAAAVGKLSGEEADEVLRTACPGAGGCGIAASFNTWGIAMEAIGLMPPNSSSNPAEEACKRAECAEAGGLVRLLLERDIRPRDLITPASLTNAAAAIAAAGGSTNGVLHVLALAKEAGVDFTLRDLQAVFRRTPVLANFAPRGTGTMFDLWKLGGTNALLKHFLAAGLLDGDCPTVTGRTLGENVARAGDFEFGEGGQTLVAPADRPFKEFADIQIAFGNLAPEGMVFKVSSLKEATFEGTAVCFESTDGILDAVRDGRVTPGSVIVLRGVGPTAAGMPEVLVASAALSTPELYGKVALLSDGRVSGVSHGAMGIHCSPEAAAGGPIGQVRDGDRIAFDLLSGTVDWTPQSEPAEWGAKKVVHRRGYLAEFAANVTQAHEGCVPRTLSDPLATPAADRGW